jgi:membrane associated rhomboid family serine protease
MSSAGVEVFRGSSVACFEYGLVLDAKGLGYERLEIDGVCVLTVAPAVAGVALDELQRYAAERLERRTPPPRFVPFTGSGIGAGVYALILILVAYCAGIDLFGIDWLARGALVSRIGGAGEWWRAVTALTLHLDQEHLLGNLMFGCGVGMLAARMFGPGVAWLAILVSGALGDYVDMLVSPPWHRAVGASTAVFAALGLLAGFGWGQTLSPRARRLYRWAPLFAGVCLLALLGAGAGDQHVDVLGHLLGFGVGVALGWGFARTGVPRNRGARLQFMAGAAAVAIVCTAWIAALQHA